MGRSNPTVRHQLDITSARDPMARREIVPSGSEVDELREENAQLRELVIQLSKIAIRNIAERK
jgi:transposase-like protein